MKKYIYSLLVILTFSFTANAQERNKRKEKIKALKIAYLSDELNLTSQEAEKFWPIYNQHENNTHKVIRNKSESIRKELLEANGVDYIDEKRAEALFELIQNLEKNKFEENQKYYKKLKNILPIKKILKLQIAEREFGRKLMRKYRRKRPRD